MLNGFLPLVVRTTSRGLARPKPLINSRGRPLLASCASGGCMWREKTLTEDATADPPGHGKEHKERGTCNPKNSGLLEERHDRLEHRPGLNKPAFETSPKQASDFLLVKREFRQGDCNDSYCVLAVDHLIIRNLCV